MWDAQQREIEGSENGEDNFIVIVEAYRENLIVIVEEYSENLTVIVEEYRQDNLIVIVEVDREETWRRTKCMYVRCKKYKMLVSIELDNKDMVKQRKVLMI